MSKTGRNDPCPSGAGVKFKNCLRQHPELDAKCSAAAVWWVCRRWQAADPDLGALYDVWLRLHAPDQEKCERFVERVLAEPAAEVDWPRLLRQSLDTGYPDVPRLYRRASEVLSAAGGTATARLHATAAELFRFRNPEMFDEVLNATLALAPTSAGRYELETIAGWANDLDREDARERLREHFPDFPEGMLEGQWGDGGPDDSTDMEVEPESEIPPEVRRQADLIWDEFEAVASPTPAQVDALVDRLLALPDEATEWTEVFEVVRQANHPAVFEVFDRNRGAISPASDDQPYLHWGAISEAARRGETERMPVIARSYHRLTAENYDADALSRVADYLLACGFAGECLELMEHFFPFVREDNGLMGWVAPETAAQLFTLRLGHQVASGALPGKDTGRDGANSVVAALLAGIEDEIDKDPVLALAEHLSEPPDGPRSDSAFELALHDDPPERVRGQWVAIHAAFVEVARDEWKAGHGHPARTLTGLQMMHAAAEHWIESRREKRRNYSRKLLDYLDPTHIERQVANECRDFLGVNSPRAHTMLEAHTALARWASRQGMLDARAFSGTVRQVQKLLEDVAFSR